MTTGSPASLAEEPRRNRGPSRTESASPPLWRSMLFFLLPLIAGNFLQSLSTTVGALYYGQMIGVGALAAAAAFFPVMFFLISFLIGFSNAAAVLVGQASGANDPAQARRIAGTTLTVCLLFGISVTLLFGTFANGILLGLDTPPDIIADALSYARAMLIFMPLLFLFIAYTTVLRGVGDTRSPFFALLISTVVSLLLTPALIDGSAGLPKLGILSGPFAGVASYIVSLAWLFVHLYRNASPLAPDRKLLSALGMNRAIVRQLLAIGVPSGAQIVFVAMSEVAVIAFVNVFGSGATAAYGTVNQIVGYVQFPAVSIGIAASIFAAQAIGAGRSQDLPAITRTAMGLNAAIGGGIIAAVYLFSGVIVGWFIDAPPTAAIAQRLIDITLWGYLMFGMSQVLQGVMRGSGTVFWPTLISVATIWGLQVPASYALSRWIGLDGVWVAYPAAFACGLAAQTAFYCLIWRRRSHARLV